MCRKLIPAIRSVRVFRKHMAKRLISNRVTEVEEISGTGCVPHRLTADWLLQETESSWISLESPYTRMQEGWNSGLRSSRWQTYAGCILISDLLKPHAKEAIAALKNAGVTRDGYADRRYEACSGCRWQQSLVFTRSAVNFFRQIRYAKVEELLARKSGKEKLAFVGDGINDAPVLSRADIGIAMGALGSDAAIEAADIVLMDDDPLKIAKAIRISRKCIRIVYENIYFATRH